MKTTISINKEDFNSDAKRMVVITTNEQALILQAVEALEAQAATLKALLRSIGFDQFTTLTDNPRTIARLNLTVKGDNNDNS
ncbi:MAG: hypothetical protein ACPGMT_07070 [Candidatus Puniceispirillaceae bacterium]